jgi:hypothetical protein
MKTNKTIKIFRDASPTGLGGDRILELVDSPVPVWIAFTRRVFFTQEGVEAISEATLRVAAHFGIKDEDVIELSNDPTKRFRVGSANEIYSSSGRLVGHTCDLVRDSSVE